MSSVLSTFATHWLRSPARPGKPVRPSGAFGRKAAPPLSGTIRLVLARAYRAMIDARMRRIRMELALHGVRYDRADDPSANDSWARDDVKPRDVRD